MGTSMGFTMKNRKRFCVSGITSFRELISESAIWTPALASRATLSSNILPFDSAIVRDSELFVITDSIRNQHEPFQTKGEANCWKVRTKIFQEIVVTPSATDFK